MIVDVQGDEPPHISPACYFAGLQAAASYVIDNGLPFFASGHIHFMKEYLKAWDTKSSDEAVREASADLARLEKKTQDWLHPVLVQLEGLFRAVFSSAWMVLAKSIRIVPPLITAVVVVFVTSDAWRLLGTGFTPRTICLVALFLVTSLVFLIRFKGYWEDDWDISASKDIQKALLRDIRNEMEHDQEAYPCAQWQHFHKLIERGAKTVPLVKRVNLGGRVCLYGGYLVVSAFSLVVVALVVSASLILIGLILISAKETGALTGQSAHIWLRLPGHIVITRELVSLSVCLGAFAVFFLVAGQRTADRKEFMDSVLADVRRIFVVYSVYCRAHDHAEKWTDIRVDSPPLVPKVRQRRNHRPGVHPRGRADETHG